MARKFSSNLSVEGIKNLQQELKSYSDGLAQKNRLFVERLAQSGIMVAMQNVGGFGRYVTFRVDITQNNSECKAILVATNTGYITNQWQTKDGIKSADVSPLLMAEFGSGQRAENPMGVPGVGQGTFPGQTHAFDSNGWYWQTLDGEWHHSKGISPSMPMYKAMLEMHANIRNVAKEVYGS